MLHRKPAFSFVLKESFREISKDSNNYSTTYTLKEGKLQQDYIYKGFPDDKEEHKQVRANGSTIEAILAKIEAQSLFINYDKQFPLNSNGPRTSIGIHLTVQHGTSTYTISVSGDRLQVQNDEMYKKVSVLQGLVSGFFQK